VWLKIDQILGINLNPTKCQKYTTLECNLIFFDFSSIELCLSIGYHGPVGKVSVSDAKVPRCKVCCKNNI